MIVDSQDFNIESTVFNPNRTKNRIYWTDLSLRYQQDLLDFQELELEVNSLNLHSYTKSSNMKTKTLYKPHETNDFSQSSFNNDNISDLSLSDNKQSEQIKLNIKRDGALTYDDFIQDSVNDCLI
jgi:hypothetical protein